MGRKKDEYYWSQVDREEDGGLKCKNCRLKFKGGVSRIKAHIDGVTGKGISICRTPPKDITPSNHSHQRINVPSSQEMDGAASTSLAALFEVDEIREVSEDGETEEILNETLPEGNVEECGNGVLTTLKSKLDELRSDLICEEEDIQGQLQLLESHGKKRKRKVDHWLKQIQNMKQRAIDMKDSLNQFGCFNFYVLQGEMYLAEESQKKIQYLTEEIQKHKKLKPPVLSNEYFGREFEKNVEKLWKLMKDDRVFIIGIYGMGGVGKTFLANYMQNEIKRIKTFEDVLWVTVSHYFTIFKLQERIAKIIKVELHTDDERERAMVLAKELEKRENITLILDDVWKYIDLENVGISFRVNGIKLIMTSRSRDVFQQMNCLSINIIEVNPFRYDRYLDYDYDDYDDSDDSDIDDEDDYVYEEEAWMFFLLKLKSYGTPLTLFPQVRNIARSIVKNCYGLPLAINVMARTMKGKTDIHWWRHVLNKFDKLEMGVEMEEKVFTVLRRSYDNLSGKDLQKCFLYIALLPNFMIRNCLIGKLVNTGLLDGNKSLEEIFDETNVIVDELINHSLLEAEKAPVLSSVENALVLSMHGLVRKMALNILKELVSYMMIKCNGNMPDTQKWAIDLEVVSLAKNKIKTIPEGTSPNCPRLLTLLLFETHITRIPGCFFTHMNALTTLHLSKNLFLRCLPHSLSNLRSLTSLMLNECENLEDIPPLGELQSLLRLEISNCSIRAPPEGLENLVNLKWLDLSMNKNLKLVPGSFLPSLTKIRYLDLSGCIGGIGVKDVNEMTMLECFAGTFVDHDNFDYYVKQILNCNNGPQTYFIHMDDESKISLSSQSCLSTFNDRTISFRNCKEVSYVLPRHIMKLLVYRNDHWVCLCDAISKDNFLLEEICIHDWQKLTSLFCSSCSICTNIPKLHTLRCKNLESITIIYKEFPGEDMFCNLKTLDVYRCHRMKILLAICIAQKLPHLKSISVSFCNSMEQIFGVAYDDSDESEGEYFHDKNNIRLHKLTCLIVADLPQLKNVYEGILYCKSGFEPSISNCPKLCNPIIEYVAL